METTFTFVTEQHDNSVCTIRLYNIKYMINNVIYTLWPVEMSLEFNFCKTSLYVILQDAYSNLVASWIFTGTLKVRKMLAFVRRMRSEFKLMAPMQLLYCHMGSSHSMF